MNQLAPMNRTDGAVAQRGGNDYDHLRFQLERRVDDFKMALPAHITPEKFQRTIMTAAQSNPDLLRADRGSFITSCMKAAQDGLLPDGREAAIVTFTTRKKDAQGQWSSVVLAQYMPMVFGLRKKILQSGEISTITTGVVYKREYEEGYFIYEEGTDAMLRHKPMLDLADADATDDMIVAAYSIAVMKDGSKSFEVMSRAKINKVRQSSQTGALGKTTRDGKPIPPKGPWVDWFDEMARKTVMRRHSKTLPMSGDILDVEAHDEALAARSATGVLEAVEPDAPRALPSRDETTHDPETGEINDDSGESEEDVARRLDAEQEAAREGRADADMGEAHNGAEPEQAAESERDWNPTITSIENELSGCATAAAVNEYWASVSPLMEEAPEAVRNVALGLKNSRAAWLAKKAAK